MASFMFFISIGLYFLFFHILLDAVKKNYPAQDGSDLKIANAVKDWLKYAKARMHGGKSK